jgi:phosphoribosylformimino-5-aminoimidazole carboxamide ribotide isomerase
MLLIPAIDLKEGKCVRLRQGRMEDSTIFSEDPLEVAGRWVEQGAQRLHLVDLDGAFSGKPENRQIIARITEAFPEIDTQVGGGIRDKATLLAYLDTGVRYVIVGTKAVTTPHFLEDICLEFPGHIILGLDTKDGHLAVDGWSKLHHQSAIDFVKKIGDVGIESIIFTDISRDGMMQGFNAEATAELAREGGVPVIASGGISTYEDIKRLCEVEADGVEGAIIGRALYEGTITLPEARTLVDSLTGELQ